MARKRGGEKYDYTLRLLLVSLGFVILMVLFYLWVTRGYVNSQPTGRAALADSVSSEAWPR